VDRRQHGYGACALSLQIAKMSGRIPQGCLEMTGRELAMRKPMRGLAYFSVIGIFGSGLDAIAQTPDGAASSAVPGIAAPLADGRAGIASLAGAAPAPRSGAVNVISPAAQSSSAQLAAPSSLTPGSSATRASTIQRDNVISSAAPRFAATARLSSAAPGAPTFPANSATRLAGAAPPSAAISAGAGNAGIRSTMTTGVASASVSAGAVSSATAAASLPGAPAVGLISRPQ
jgi:hypothetical protein